MCAERSQTMIVINGTVYTPAEFEELRTLGRPER